MRGCRSGGWGEQWGVRDPRERCGPRLRGRGAWGHNEPLSSLSRLPGAVQGPMGRLEQTHALFRPHTVSWDGWPWRRASREGGSSQAHTTGWSRPCQGPQVYCKHPSRLPKAQPQPLGWWPPPPRPYWSLGGQVGVGSVPQPVSQGPPPQAPGLAATGPGSPGAWTQKHARLRGLSPGLGSLSSLFLQSSGGGQGRSAGRPGLPGDRGCPGAAQRPAWARRPQGPVAGQPGSAAGDPHGRGASLGYHPLRGEVGCLGPDGPSRGHTLVGDSSPTRAEALRGPEGGICMTDEFSGSLWLPGRTDGNIGHRRGHTASTCCNRLASPES